jgi:hypothetical protein
MTPCNWPFHNDPNCHICKAQESLHADALDRYLMEKAAEKEAKRAKRK